MAVIREIRIYGVENLAGQIGFASVVLGRKWCISRGLMRNQKPRQPGLMAQFPSFSQKPLDLLKVLEGDEETDWGSLIREMAEKQDPLVAVVDSSSLQFERGAHGPKEQKKRKRRRRRSTE